MTTIDENIINLAEDAVRELDEANVVDTVINMEPTISRKGAGVAKGLVGAALVLIGAAVYLVKTKETRELKKQEKAVKYLEDKGYTVTKNIIEAEAEECEDEDVDYEGDEE